MKYFLITLLETMDIKYSLTKLENNLFAIVVPNDYDRAMLFLRVQEFSDSPRYKGKSFKLLDFMKWYAEETDEGFTYAIDWAGFNVSYESAIDCYRKTQKSVLTRYDYLFLRILKRIAQQIGSLKAKAYIIGVDALNSYTMYHERYHAMYYLDDEYQKNVNEAIQRIPKRVYERLAENLKQIGYSKDKYTINNEIQSYLRGRDDWSHPDFSKGLDMNELRKVRKKFLDNIRDFTFSLTPCIHPRI